MSYRIVPTLEFIKQAKKLSKKYPKISQDLKDLHEILEKDPHSGTHLGKNCYKIRLQNISTQKGKSGGFRVIVFVIDKDKVIRLIAIYSKSERNSMPDEEIKMVLKKNKLS